MLAVQRPSMGSTKPPNVEMPFGYSFDTANSNYPFPSPTPPAPGPSLLDDNESKFLDNFFDGVSSDQFNYDFFNNGPDGSELGLGWDELPPTFMGTASSFGQQNDIGSQGQTGLDYGAMNTHMNAAPPIPTTTSADVIAAATLLQNGSSGRSFGMTDGSSLRHRESQMMTTNGLQRAQSVQSNLRLQQGLSPITSGENFLRDTYASNLASHPRPNGSTRQRHPNTKLDIRWGSDSSFNTSQGFMPPPGPDSMSANERYHIHTIENAFSIGTNQIPSSADTTEPSSPLESRGSQTQKQHPTSTKSREIEEDAEPRPRKRRRSNHQADDDEDDDDLQTPPTSATSNKSSTKKRKPIKKELDASQQPIITDIDSPGHKRRKSTNTTNNSNNNNNNGSTSTTAAAAKATRENLTEEQKRENHIKSEQKRRTLIREGFEDLGELVPGLRGGGFSKSAVLTMAADWLEDLLQGNEVLQGRLDELEGRGS